jgi:Secretion system C-terminal sorting domain
MKNQLSIKLLKTCVTVLITISTSFNVFANETKSPPPVATGTYSVGTGGTYTSSITAALTSINAAGGISGPIVLQLLSTYTPVTETLPAVTGASPTNTITIRPALGVTKTITTSTTTPTFLLTAAKYFIIDGRAGGIGTSKSLIIESTSTNGSAMTLKTESSNNVIQYCILRGAATSINLGVVILSTSVVAGTTGNDNNTITNCDITSASTSALAINGIYSKGENLSKSNDDNTISNCNIYDISHITAKSFGIFIDINNKNWTITRNSIYQTVARSSTTTWTAIGLSNNINGGNGFIISKNFIGGTAPLAGGSKMDFTFTATGFFTGISIYGYLGSIPNTIDSNIVKNISITCNVANLHYGIYHADGTVNIINNTIGDTLTKGSIVFNSSAITVVLTGVSPAFTAICAGGGSTPGTIGGNVKMQKNIVGSIRLNATGGTGANEFRGIFYQGSYSLVDISDNIVGGTIDSSLYNSGNGATVGIVINSGYTLAANTIKNNIVRNLNSSNSVAAPRGSLEGLTTQAGMSTNAAYIVENNIIKDLTSNNAFTMVGLKTSATIATQIITKNKIFNIKNQSTLSGSNVVGIELADYTALATVPFATASELSRNTITNLEMSATVPNAGSVVWGLSANAGRFNILNNMIAMGYGIGNASITKNYEIVGISNNLFVAKPCYLNIYYNTVHVGGTGVVAGSASSKCYAGKNAGTTDFKNNIFYNSRSNAGGSTIHYSLFYSSPAVITSDYNVLSAVSTGSMVAGYSLGSTFDYPTTNALFTAKAIDGNSFSDPVKFVNNATDLRPVASPDVANFFIANEGLPILSCTTDIDGNTRNTCFPDMGCFEFKGTGCWIGQTSSAWGINTVGGNWDDGIIPPSTWDVKIFPCVDPSVTQPIMLSSAGIGTVKDLYVRTTSRTINKSLITVNTGTLQIYGAVKFWKNAVYDGVIDARLGTVEMKGTSGVQTLSPRWFVKKEIETLTNSNSTGLTIAAPTASDTMLITKMLNYGAGTTGSVITTNDNLTLLSRASGTANFGEIVTGSGNSIVGKVNIERYLFAQKAWRFLAAPVQVGTSPSIATAWRESNGAFTNTGYGVNLTGPAGPTVASPSGELDLYSVRGSMKYYDDINNSWIELSNTSTTKIGNAKGYMVFVRGDRGAANTTAGAGTTTNLRIKGDINTGNQIFSVLPNGKFQSIGNPYPSQINFSTITKPFLPNAFTVWNPKLPGLYAVGGYENYSLVGTDYRLNGTATGTIRNTIESGEAFFVQNNSTTAGTVTIKESDKGLSTNMVSRAGGTAIVKPTMDIHLFEKDENGSFIFSDAVSTSFDNSFAAGIDNDDVVKFTNVNNNLFIKSSNNNLLVERRPTLTESDTIKIGITGTRVAQYRLQLDPYLLENIGLNVFLLDRFLQTTTALDLIDSTIYTFNITTNVASKAADRFLIVFKQATATSFTTISAIRNADKTVTVNFGTANEKNVINYTVEQSNDAVNFVEMPITIAPTSNIGGNPIYTKLDATASKMTNWYRVKIKNSNNSFIYSAIAMVASVTDIIDDTKPTVTIYPNPVQDGNINLYFDNQKAGTFTIKIINQSGQTLQAEKVQIASNKIKKAIQVNNLASGNYQIVITNASGEQSTLSMLAK